MSNIIELIFAFLDSFVEEPRADLAHFDAYL